MKIVLVVIIFVLFSCSSSIDYPEGGYAYPTSFAKRDTNFYYYPLKNTFSRKDSFDYAREYTFFRAFNEPNISLFPLEREEFRLVCQDWARNSYIIILTENEIKVKSGDPSNMYKLYENTLTETEKIHLSLLQSSFPLDVPHKNIYRQHYIDSIIRASPVLLDPTYYSALIEKKYVLKNTKFVYNERKFPITKKQYVELIDSINSAGFWSLPFKIDCAEPPTDDNVYILEANTRYKYMLVDVDGCPPDTTRFTKACQLIVNAAHLADTIHLAYRPNKNGEASHQLIIKEVQLEEVKPLKHKKH